jgi:hypothetical protein
MSPSEAPWFALAAITLAVMCLGMVVALRHKRAVLHHEERMAAIEKGGQALALDEERPKAPWSPRVYLLRGMLWLFVGMAIVIMFASIAVTAAHPASLSWWLSEAQSLKTQGANDEQIRQFLSDEAKRNDGPPIGLALVGLVPIGVGFAYLLFYRKETQSQLGGHAQAAERRERL